MRLECVLRNAAAGRRRFLVFLSRGSPGPSWFLCASLRGGATCLGGGAEHRGHPCCETLRNLLTLVGFLRCRRDG